LYASSDRLDLAIKAATPMKIAISKKRRKSDAPIKEFTHIKRF
jgi:hypothetical protein